MHPNELHIKPATLTDLAIIRELAHVIWPNTYGNILSEAQSAYMLEWMYSLESLQTQLQSGHQMYIAYYNNEALGFATCEHTYQANAVNKLHKIYVLPSAQGKGVGFGLLHKIILEEKKSESTTLSLNVNRHNKVKEFYLRNNFKVVATEDIDIGNGYLMEDYIMELAL